MQTIDLGIAWTWSGDADFVHILEAAALRNGLSVLCIEKASVADVLRTTASGELRLRWLLDRASDEDHAFMPLAEWALSTHSHPGVGTVRIINVHDHARRSSDKATMHLDLLSRGINVPHTIILPSFNDQRDIPVTNVALAPLGKSFVVKPANTTGGGHGVVMNVSSIAEVGRIRQTHPSDKYLLQETVIPAYLSESRAWFRIFAACGEFIPCWWDDRTHAYEEITPDDFHYFGLQALVDTMERIAQICQLDFFSSEMVQTLDGRIVVVDYVNEMCDMRLQSKVPNGVPDAVVNRIARQIIEHVAKEGGVSIASRG